MFTGYIIQKSNRALNVCSEVSCHTKFLKPNWTTKRFSTGSVSTNGIGCAEAGIEIMKKGGKAVDVAIATLFSEGVSMPSTMGLGGGFLMLIYKKSSGEISCLDSRETAPAAATEDMFVGRPELALIGGSSVAVPGELSGYWHAFKKFGGGVQWDELPKDAIKKCRNGILMDPFTSEMVERSKEAICADPGLRKIFVNPKTNETYKEGDCYKNPILAKTLEIIAKEGGEALHNGSLTKRFVEDIQSKNGIITVEDMNNYRPKWKKPTETTVLGKKLYSFPLPSSGPLLTFMVNILDGFLETKNHSTPENYNRLIETLKFAYGARTNLGDDDFFDLKEILANITSKKYAVEIRKKIFDNSTSQDPAHYGAKTISNEDHGTGNICVVHPNGDVVSVTSSINYIFGAKFMSESTGIILNDIMDDFSIPGRPNIFNLPPSPANLIVPGKRPMSSMCPSIILDENGDMYMVIGGAGGSKITSNVLQVIINRAFYGMSPLAASDEPRCHHQLLPMNLELERDFQQKKLDVVDGLRKIGHDLTFADPDGFAAVTLIAKDKRTLVGVVDKRRGGSVDYLY